MITNLKQVNSLQKQYGYYQYQKLINSGQIWKFEGSIGREAMSLLKIGICYLPLKATFDYYNNRIPSRLELKEGTKGTKTNSIIFWNKVNNGEALIF